MNIIALSFKNIMGLNFDYYIKITGPGSIFSSTALTGEAQLVAISNPGRDIDRYFAAADNPAFATAFRTGFFHYFAFTLTAVTDSGLGNLAKGSALTDPNLAGSLTFRAGFSAGSRFGPTATAGRAVFLSGYGYLLFCSKGSLFKGYFQFIFKILAAAWSSSGAGASATAAPAAAKKHLKNVIQTAKTAPGKFIKIKAEIFLINTRVPVLIITLAFIRITQDIIGFRNFLEFICGIGVITAVGMIFFGQFTIGLFYLILIRTPAYSQNLVIIFFCRHNITIL